VLDGLFGLAKRLFDVDIEAADGQVGSAPDMLSSRTLRPRGLSHQRGVCVLRATCSRAVTVLHALMSKVAEAVLSVECLSSHLSRLLCRTSANAMSQGVSQRVMAPSSAAAPQAPVWHPDVRFFKLSVKGQPKAYFYLDPYSRPEEKRGGAWMAEVHHG
jgi:Peptidase family M3